MWIFPVGQRVEFRNWRHDKGTIASLPFDIKQPNGLDTSCVVVRLDKGFYSEDKETFVSALVVNREIIFPIDENGEPDRRYYR